MAEIPKPVSFEHIPESGEANLGSPAMMGSDHRQGLQRSEAATAANIDCFVTVDIESLSPTVASNNKNSTSSPRVMRTLSRKGGGERKAAEGDVTTFPSMGGGAMAHDKASLHVHLAIEQEASGASGLVPAASPTSAGAGGGRGRRLGKRNSSWLDPRRVLLFFATMSSLGTLMVLYFTLSMS